MKKMKLTDTHKSIIFGIVVACLLTSLSSGTYFGITTTGSNLSIQPFEWDFDSGIRLSLQINERSDYLYKFMTYVAKVTQPWSAEQQPYFNYSVGFLASWLNVISDEWMFRITRHVSPWKYVDIIKPNLLVNLHSALVEDIKTFQDLTDITENWGEYLEEHFVTDKTLFEVTHIYQDGTGLMFRSFDNVVFIKYWRFTKYYSDDTGSGTKKDKNFEEQWFMATMPDLFPNYTNAINQLLEQYFGTVE